VEDNPGLGIFIPSLGKGIFGGPLHIIAFVTGIDTGFLDFKGIHDLHGFQFHEPSATKITGHDILGKLGMGTCGRATGCTAVLAEDLQVMFAFVYIELLLGKSKN
jgi:hypothetical protein